MIHWYFSSFLFHSSGANLFKQRMLLIRGRREFWQVVGETRRWDYLSDLHISSDADDSLVHLTIHSRDRPDDNTWPKVHLILVSSKCIEATDKSEAYFFSCLFETINFSKLSLLRLKLLHIFSFVGNFDYGILQCQPCLDKWTGEKHNKTPDQNEWLIHIWHSRECSP